MICRASFFVIFPLAALIAVLPLCAQEQTHTVQKGETFFSIARDYGVTRNDLLRANNISDPSRLYVGQRLRIPGSAAVAPPGRSTASRTYRVRNGDTLYSIARRHNVALTDLLNANGLNSGYVLKVNDTLKIPGGAPSRSPAPAPAPVPAVPVGLPRTQPAEIAGTPFPESQIPDTAGTDQTTWPISAKSVNEMKGKLRGLLLYGSEAEPVKAVASGTVISAGPYRGFGRVAIVQSDGGYLYVYGGMRSLSVKEGDPVGPGAQLGNLGVDAVSGLPSLFFLVYRNSKPVDPAAAPRA
jgi:murein DD-endopeptidase MepM/ murein hydrolase activator NlpD